MNPEEKQEFLNKLYEAAENAKTIEEKERLLSIISIQKQQVSDKAEEIHEILNNSTLDGLNIMYHYTWDQYTDLCLVVEEMKELEDEIVDSIEILKGNAPKKEKITFIGSFFKKLGKKKTSKETFNDEDFVDEYEEIIEEAEAAENFEDNLEDEDFSLKTVLVRGGITAAALVVIGGITWAGITAHNNAKEKAALKQQLKEMEEAHQNSLAKLEEIAKAEQQRQLLAKEEAQTTKEENIVKLVQQLQEELNKYEGMNVTFEQALSLFIHLNVGNSYAEENEYALDAVTRTNLIKQYYVGLTKGTEEFDSYVITDADLSKLSSDVFNIRNAAINRVIVLNDEGKYEESKEIIGLFQGFITEASLQDEAEEFTTSMKDMQTSDKKQLKEEIYKYYNYLFAGPKSEVRNFDDYGHYVDGDNKEMTFENQGATMRFYTWFMDGFASINLSTNLIPQDIINSAQAKLLDQATLMRMLGYKNCGNVFNAYYGIDFDNAIDNRIKSNSKKSTSNKSQLDKDIHNGLLQNPNPGDTFTTSDGKTVTVVETGDNEVVVEVPGGNEEQEDTTPPGPSEREETEGGGNEEREEIVFPEDPTEEIIDEGGDVIQESSEEVPSQEKESEAVPAEVVEEKESEAASTEIIEEIIFEEDNNIEISSIEDEINQLLFIRQAILGEEIVPNCNVYIEEEKGFEKTYKC